MRLLLDSHTFLWWMAGSERLPIGVRLAIIDDANIKLVSAATAWEIATKHRLGKLKIAREFVQDIGGAISQQGFDELPITVSDASRAGSLPGEHRDPFDRMLIAQALVRDLVLVSSEKLFDAYGVRRFW